MSRSGVSGSGADETDLARRVRAPALAERGFERAVCAVLASREHLLSDRAVHHVLEEPPPPHRVGDAPEHGGPDLADEPGEPPERRRYDGFEARAQDAREYGSGAPRGQRRDQRRAVDDRGQDERTQRLPVDGVDRDVPPPGGVRDGVGEGVVLRRDDGQPHAVHVAFAERPPSPRDPRLAGERAQPRRQVRRDDGEPRARPQQQPGLGFRRFRAAGEQAGARPRARGRSAGSPWAGSTRGGRRFRTFELHQCPNVSRIGPARRYLEGSIVTYRPAEGQSLLKSRVRSTSLCTEASIDWLRPISAGRETPPKLGATTPMPSEPVIITVGGSSLSGVAARRSSVRFHGVSRRGGVP